MGRRPQDKTSGRYGPGDAPRHDDGHGRGCLDDDGDGRWGDESDDACDVLGYCEGLDYYGGLGMQVLCREMQVWEMVSVS